MKKINIPEYKKIEVKKNNSKKEKIGWKMLAEKSLNKIWNNKKDDLIWNNYL